MTESPTNAAAPTGPGAADSWVTSLWQDIFTADTTSLLDGATVVSHIEQPVLWQFVNQLALEAGVPAPATLRVVGNAHVITHTDPYTLDIGVPFLLALDQGDLAEVISRVLVEGGTAAEPEAVIEAPKQRRGLFGGRKKEQAPAPVALRPSGTARLETAIHEATQWWIEEFIHPDLTDSLVPRPVYLGLAELLGERGMEIADAAELAPRPEDPSRPNAGDPALFLLMDPDALFENVADAGLPPGTGELEWEDAMARWANRRSRASSIILFNEAKPPVSALWELLDIVSKGGLKQRVEDALRAPGAATEEDCVFLLTGVLADALADVGAGMLTCSWGGVIDLISTTEGPLDLSGVARQVVKDPTVVPFLRDILKEYLVSPQWAPKPDETGDDRALESFLAETGRRQAPGTGFLTGM